MFPQGHLNASNPKPRPVSAGRGFTWIKQSFLLVREQVLTWVLISLPYMMIMMLLRMVPLLSLVAAVLSVVVSGSFVLMAHKSYNGQALRLNDVALGFQRYFRPLINVGLMFMVISLLGSMLHNLLTQWLLGEQGMAQLLQFVQAMSTQEGLTTDSVKMLNSLPQDKLLIALALGLLLIWLVTVLGWLVVPLVVQNNAQPMDAMRTGLRALAMNALPLVVCTLGMWLLAFLCLLTLGLGFVLWVPMSFVLSYVIWRDVFATA